MFWKSEAVGRGAPGRAAAAPGAATAAAAAAKPVAGAVRSRPTSRRCCAAARTAFAAYCPAVWAGAGIAIVVLGIVVIWLASGFYRVVPDEVGRRAALRRL